jgi:hypothetical protein
MLRNEVDKLWEEKRLVGAVQLRILCQVGQYNRRRLSVRSSVGETNLDANGREALDRDQRILGMLLPIIPC